MEDLGRHGVFSLFVVLNSYVDQSKMSSGWVGKECFDNGVNNFAMPIGSKNIDAFTSVVCKKVETNFEFVEVEQVA